MPTDNLHGYALTIVGRTMVRLHGWAQETSIDDIAPISGSVLTAGKQKSTTLHSRGEQVNLWERPPHHYEKAVWIKACGGRDAKR